MDSSQAASPARKQEWMPRVWQGCDFFAWLRLLVRNRFAVHPSCWYIAGIATVFDFLPGSPAEQAQKIASVHCKTSLSRRDERNASRPSAVLFFWNVSARCRNARGALPTPIWPT